jgi:hypothetical protein
MKQRKKAMTSIVASHGRFPIGHLPLSLIALKF